MLRSWSLLVVCFSALALLVSAGCTTRTPPGEAAPAAERQAEHAHRPGQHGGTIVEIGRDNYHAEVLFEPDRLRLYLLGKDEARIQEVELQDLTAHARPAEGDTKPISFVLKAAPRKDDTPGKTSRFEGLLPAELRERRFEVTVPTIRIEGGRFRFAFRNYREGERAMPKAVASSKAKQLYLTPGGKYTTADIRANGRQTARQKYGDEMSEHDAHPKKGEKVCPISKTRANPKFTWVVGGKTYEFCCTPCIDEFVRTAKEKPDQVKQPGDYVQK